MTISKEDRELIRKFENIMSRGHYADSTQVTLLYNKVLQKNEHVTNCSQCLRKRIQGMAAALNKLEEQERKQQEKITAKEAEEKKEEEQTKEEQDNGDNTEPPKTTRGKKGKKQNGV